MRISITLYQKPKVNFRNHRALQTIQLYEAFLKTLKNGVRYTFYQSIDDDKMMTL